MKIRCAFECNFFQNSDLFFLYSKIFLGNTFPDGYWTHRFHSYTKNPDVGDLKIQKMCKPRARSIQHHNLYFVIRKINPSGVYRNGIHLKKEHPDREVSKSDIPKGYDARHFSLEINPRRPIF